MHQNVVFGFGDPPSQALMSLHTWAGLHGVAPLYNYQPIVMDCHSLERGTGILTSESVLGCHFAEPLQASRCPWLEHLAQGSLSSGRVNIIYKDDMRITGDDTLHSGSLRALANAGFSSEGSRVLLLGSGPEAQGIVRSRAVSGMSRLLLLHSSIDRIRVMASAIKRELPHLSVMIGSLQNENLQSIVNDIDLLINALDTDDQTIRALMPTTLRLPQHLHVIDLGLTVNSMWAMHDDELLLTQKSIQVWQNAECFRLWNNRDLPGELLHLVTNDAH